MRILGIETSCDETGLAIYDTEQGLLGHVLHTQAAVHAQYGGVVPELASRDHIRFILPLLDELLTQTNAPLDSIDGVAYTAGPGLIGALFVGASVARSLAWSLNLPAVGVHHLEGHLLAPMLETRRAEFPFLALLVSGGHTQLVRVGAVGDYELLGESLDDAVGEAFDKVAKLMGLGYPGGPALAAIAGAGDPSSYRFPRPMTDRPGLDFSFSGLKTFTANIWHASAKDDKAKAEIASAFQEAAVDTLYIKTRRALKQTGLTRLVVAGGVGANQRLRSQFQAFTQDPGVEVYFPRPAFCTDNGAMIAYAGAQRLLADQEDPLAIHVYPRWSLVEEADR